MNLTRQDFGGIGKIAEIRSQRAEPEGWPVFFTIAHCSCGSCGRKSRFWGMSGCFLESVLKPENQSGTVCPELAFNLVHRLEINWEMLSTIGEQCFARQIKMFETFKYFSQG